MAVISFTRFRRQSVDLFGYAGHSAGLRVMVAAFVTDGSSATKARAQAQRIAEDIDDGEARHANLGLIRAVLQIQLTAMAHNQISYPAAFASFQNILTVSSEYSVRSFPSTGSLARMSLVAVMM